MDIAVAQTDRPRVQLLVFLTSSLIACGLKKMLVVSGLRGILIGGILRQNRVFVESFIKARESVRIQGHLVRTVATRYIWSDVLAKCYACATSGINFLPLF